jgi:hypothetical protein
VEVGSQKQTIVWPVLPTSLNRKNVRCLEHGQCLLPGHGTTTLEVICHENAERALTKTAFHQHRVTKHRLALARLGHTAEC